MTKIVISIESWELKIENYEEDNASYDARSCLLTLPILTSLYWAL